MKNKLLHMTNATKAQIIILVNTLLALLISFGLDLSDGQVAAITTFVNAVLGAWVGITYKDSTKRIPDRKDR